VVRRGWRRLTDTGASVVDYGIRGMHLAYDLLDDWDALVLVDAVPSQGSPGTLHVFEADHESMSSTPALDAHSMEPAAVFASLAALGGEPPYTVVVGCEAENVDESLGLSPSVDGAVDGAVDAVADVVSTVSDRAATGGS
jgi:hydrogenase maturation protease